MENIQGRKEPSRPVVSSTGQTTTVGDQTTKKDEDLSLGDSQSTSETSSSISSFSTQTVVIETKTVAAIPTRRTSLQSDDLANLIISLASDKHGIAQYDTCTGTTPLRHRTTRTKLNETIYELIKIRTFAIENETGGGALLRSTPDTPFVDAPLTGNEDIDAFVAERTAKEYDVPGNISDSENEENEVNEKSKAWQSTSVWRRGLMVLLFSLLAIVLLHIGSFFLLIYSTNVYEHPYTCKTKDCDQLSEWLRRGIDNKTHPCDNFYEFACGTYNKNYPNLEGNVSRRISEAIPFNYIGNQGLGRMLHRVTKYPLNQILPFYQACIDQDQRDKVGVRPFINMLFHYNLMDPVKRGKTLDISRVIVRIYKKLHKSNFIDMYYGSRESFLVVGLCKIDKEFLLVNSKEYATAMRDAFTLLKRDLNIVDDSEIDTIVYLVMRFEAELVLLQSKESVKIFGFPDEMEKHVKVPSVFHPNYQPSHTAYFRFDSLVSEMFHQYPNVENATRFVNYIHSIPKKLDRLYILYMEDLLNRTPYYVLFRYLQWGLIKYFGMDLTSQLQEIMFHIFPWVGPTPDERCFRNMFAKLNVLAAARYSLEIANLATIEFRLQGLVGKLWGTFNRLASDFPIAVVDSIKETVASLVIMDSSVRALEPYLHIFYQGLDMNMNRHFENVLQATAANGRNDVLKLINLPPFHLWPISEYSVDEITISIRQNAHETKRIINTPFGALQRPFYGSELPLFDLSGLGFWIAAYYMAHYSLNDLLAVHTKYREVEEPVDFLIPQKQMEMDLLPRLECIFNDYRKVMANVKSEFQAFAITSWGMRALTIISESVKDEDERPRAENRLYPTD